MAVISLLDRDKNEMRVKEVKSNTSLTRYLVGNFKIQTAEMSLEGYYLDLSRKDKITEEEVTLFALQRNNVMRELRLGPRVIKTEEASEDDGGELDTTSEKLASIGFWKTVVDRSSGH